MLTIVGSLLAGWILKLFGFNAVVTAGMAQVFGVTINTLGYYFLFGMIGALKSIGMAFGGGIKLNFNALKDNLEKAKAKK
jgi:hypothetical protein